MTWQNSQVIIYISFLFFYLGLTIQKEVQESITSHASHHIILLCQTAVQAIKVIFFTIITRITSSRDKFGPSEMFLRCPVVDSSISLEQQSSGCDHYYRNLIEYHKWSLTCFVIGWNIDSKSFISRVRQATKDVVKSEV